MDQIPAVMDRHLDVIQHRKEGGILLGASSLTGRYWYGSLWFYEIAAHGPDVEKCTAGVQLEAGIDDAIWIDQDKTLIGLDTGGIAVWQLVDNYKTFVQMSASVEHDSIVTTVSSFADSKKVLSASHDKSVKIWDLETLNTTTTYRDGYTRLQSDLAEFLQLDALPNANHSESVVGAFTCHQHESQ
uniref:Uncharacterized protein n=1 Tax=Octopus bimaculoides TaxID=37653 RepID=A0A0L8I061_OCTBM